MAIPTIIVSENNIPLTAYLTTGESAIYWIGLNTNISVPENVVDLTSAVSVGIHFYYKNSGTETTKSMIIESPPGQGLVTYLLQSSDLNNPDLVEAVIVGVFNPGNVLTEGGTIKWRLGQGFKIEAEN